MKIHSNVLAEADVHTACRAAGMKGVYADVTTKGSRSRRHGLEVKLTGNSTRAVNPGTSRNFARGQYADRAATWDEWGMVIMELYLIDPDAIVGPYKSKAHFNSVTGGRFEMLTAPYAHGNHKWENRGDGTQQCKFCEATFNVREAWAKAA